MSLRRANVLEGYRSDDDGDESNTSCTTAVAVCAVFKATRRTNRPSRNMFGALSKSSAAVNSSSDSYTSIVFLSDHINSNQPSVAVRAQRPCHYIAAVQDHARAIVTTNWATYTLDVVSKTAAEDAQSAIKPTPP